MWRPPPPSPADIKPEIRFESDFRINPGEFVASGLIPILDGRSLIQAASAAASR